MNSKVVYLDLTHNVSDFGEPQTLVEAAKGCFSFLTKSLKVFHLTVAQQFRKSLVHRRSS